MKNIVIAIFTSLLLFAASAGTSIYLNQPVEDLEAAEAEAMKKIDVPSDDPFPEPPIKEKAAQMPVAGRPDQGITIEAVRSMADANTQRQQQLDDREKQLQKEESRVQILFDDLKREKMELTTFSESVQAKVDALDRMTVELQKLMTNIDTQKKKLQEIQKQTGIETDKSAQLAEKVNTIKSWFEGMQPEQAASILIEQANQGDIELAAELLNSIQSRQKAKILAEIDDPALVNQILAALRIQPNPGKK